MKIQYNIRNINIIKDNFEAINRNFFKFLYNSKQYNFLYENYGFYLENNLENYWNLVKINSLDYFLIDIIEYELLNTKEQKCMYIFIEKVKNELNVTFKVFDVNLKEIQTEFTYSYDKYININEFKFEVYKDIKENVEIFINDKNLVW